MLDGWLKPGLDPLLDRAAKWLVKQRIAADAVTLTGFAVGIAAAGAIALEAYLLGLVLLLASRVGDGLDGAVARRFPARPISAAISTSCSTSSFYGAVPIGFVLADPRQRGGRRCPDLFLLRQWRELPGLCASWPRNASCRRAMRGQSRCSSRPDLPRPPKPSRCFVAFCLLPTWFPALAYAFAALTLVHGAVADRAVRAKDVSLIAFAASSACRCPRSDRRCPPGRPKGAACPARCRVRRAPRRSGSCASSSPDA